MLFTQLSFLAFFLVCFAVHWALPRQAARKPWLLACSYFFYGWWDARFLALILGATVVNYVAAAGVARASQAHIRKAWLMSSLVEGELR